MWLILNIKYKNYIKDPNYLTSNLTTHIELSGKVNVLRHKNLKTVMAFLSQEPGKSMSSTLHWKLLSLWERLLRG